MRLGILRVRPFDAEIRRLVEVLAALFTPLVPRVVEGEIAVELVDYLVPGIDVHAEGPQREVAAGKGQIEVFAEHEIHAGVLDEEAALDLFTEGRHQQTRGAGGLGRDETEGKADGEGDVADDRIGRSENRLLGRLGDHLRHRQFHIIMRMLQVADRIDAVPHVDGLVRHHLDLLALEEAFGLLGDHVGDAGLAGVEVVTELLHLVGGVALLHFGLAHPFSGCLVLAAAGEDGVRLHVILDVVRGKLHVLVGDRGAAVVIDLPFAARELRDDGVLGGGEGGTVQGTLFQHVQRVAPGDGIGPVAGDDGIGKRHRGGGVLGRFGAVAVPAE